MKLTSFCCSNCDDNLIEWHSKFTVRGDAPLHFCSECSETIYDFIINHLPHHVKSKNAEDDKGAGAEDTEQT